MCEDNMGQGAAAQFGQALDARLVCHLSGNDRGCLLGIVEYEDRAPTAQFERCTLDAGKG
jgi:hypothetical protein